MEHGGKDIMMGYGSLAEEIMQQVEYGKSVTMITAIGAGGQIGLAAYFSYFKDIQLLSQQEQITLEAKIHTIQFYQKQ